MPRGRPKKDKVPAVIGKPDSKAISKIIDKLGPTEMGHIGQRLYEIASQTFEGCEPADRAKLQKNAIEAADLAWKIVSSSAIMFPQEGVIASVDPKNAEDDEALISAIEDALEKQNTTKLKDAEFTQDISGS
jgi:hypothetical protein